MATSNTIQYALSQNARILQAWCEWYNATIKTGSATAALQKLQPAVWRAFCRSSHAAKIGIKLPEYDRSTQGIDVLAQPVPAAQPQPHPHPQPDPQPIPVPQPVPQPAAQPVPDPEPIPQPEPQPAAQPAPAPNPLLALIAQGLQEMGFSAQPAQPVVDTDTILDLVHRTVQTALETQATTLRAELAQLKQDMQPVQRIEISINGTARTVDDYTAPHWFTRLVQLHAARIPALLVGPAGSGKTTAVEKLAEAAGVPFYRLSLAEGIDDAEFTGRLLPTGDNMRFEYVHSLVTQAYTEGGVCLCDDIDLASGNMLGLLNAAADGGQWHVSLRYQDPKLVRHPDFYLVAAANTWGHGADRKYVGANQLDERTLSRFRLGQIPCDYDATMEEHIFPADTVRLGHTIRARCRALPGWTRDVSTRDLANVAQLCRVMPLEQAWYGFFADWPEADCHAVHVAVDHATMSIEVL